MSSLDKRKGAHHVVRNSPWTAELDEKLERLWLEGHSTLVIGNMLGFSKNAIVGRSRRINLPRRADPVKRLTPEQKAKILGDAASGVGPVEIARKTGLHRTTVNKVRNAGGIRLCPSCGLTKPNDQFPRVGVECRLCEREGRVVAAAAVVPPPAPRPKIVPPPRKRSQKGSGEHRRGCQWVIREGSITKPWKFCDAQVKAPGTSWCSEHYRIVFVPRKEAA